MVKINVVVVVTSLITPDKNNGIKTKKHYTYPRDEAVSNGSKRNDQLNKILIMSTFTVNLECHHHHHHHGSNANASFFFIHGAPEEEESWCGIPTTPSRRRRRSNKKKSIRIGVMKRRQTTNENQPAKITTL